MRRRKFHLFSLHKNIIGSQHVIAVNARETVCRVPIEAMIASPRRTDSDLMDSHAISDEFTSEQQALRARLPGTNIDPDSFLATDYLNHFNEVFMLLNMAGEIPEMLDDLTGWRPVDYESHFRQTGFPHKELAIEAYRLAPRHTRAQFDETVEELSALLRETISESTELKRSDALEDLARFLEVRCETLQRLHGELNSIIHSGARRVQNDDDAWSATEESPDADSDGCSDQSAIDALFD